MRLSHVSGLALGALAAWGCSGGGGAAGPTEPGAPGATVDGGADGAAAADQLPCEVDQVLAGHCRQCHSLPPAFGAPMPLVTYGDLLAPAKSNPNTPVYKMVGTRIHDDALPMPQPPNPRLNATDTATLDGWIAAGAPAATSGDACGGASDAGGASDGNVAPLSCTPDTHFAPSSAWSMPTNTDDVYVCYGVDVALTSKRQVIGFTPHIDNRTIVHHVILFQTPSAFPSGATPTPCSLGGIAGGRIIYGWAPGGLALELPAQVGFPEDPPTQHYVVQVHYNNLNHLAGQSDSTGFDLCTTDQLRPNDADVIAFGTQTINIPPHAASDLTCNFTIPAQTPPLNAFMALPHMHQLGTTISNGDVAMGGGSPVNLGDVPNWSFQNQVWQPITATLRPGDVIRTRCAWTNTTSSTVTFGPDTENEMCYSFTMYYPRVTTWNWNSPASSSTCAPTQ